MASSSASYLGDVAPVSRLPEVVCPGCQWTLIADGGSGDFHVSATRPECPFCYIPLGALLEPLPLSDADTGMRHGVPRSRPGQSTMNMAASTPASVVLAAMRRFVPRGVRRAPLGAWGCCGILAIAQDVDDSGTLVGLLREALRRLGEPASLGGELRPPHAVGSGGLVLPCPLQRASYTGTPFPQGGL